MIWFNKSSLALFHLNYFSVASLQTDESVALFSVLKQNSEKAKCKDGSQEASVNNLG